MVSTDTKNDVETFYYKQVLDHFNYLPESYNTFDQRYFINFKYWGGANSSAPMLVYLGLEETLDGIPESEGFMNENAATYKALLVFIEVYSNYFSFNI
jgi:lysosomal Pro-X carboxypeptidase